MADIKTKHKLATVPDEDQSLTDESRLADLATAKLKRQQQRIQENDAVLSVSKPKPGRKPKIEWKPFTFTYDSEDNASLPDSIDSRLATPFDVHAKPFQPTVAASRDSSQSGISIGQDHGLSSMQRGSAFLIEDDDGPEFQLVTGKKIKPPSIPALHLNAYESKTTEKIPTVAASFSKKEINDVFGNDLPPPEFVQGNPGYRHGQVQFVMHPNGDVAAQSWSSEKYQWTNIGQFSNIRRRREGMLASTRIKGESEQQTLMQNTLMYFRAVAKQHEAMEMNLPWGPKEIEAYLPTSKVGSSKFAPKVEEVKAPWSTSANQAIPSVPAASAAPSAPSAYTVAGRIPLRPSSVAFEPRAVPTLTRDDTQSSLGSMSFGSFPATTVYSAPQNEYTSDKAPPIRGLGPGRQLPGRASAVANTASISQHPLSTTSGNAFCNPHSPMSRLQAQYAEVANKKIEPWPQEESFLSRFDHFGDDSTDYEAAFAPRSEDPLIPTFSMTSTARRVPSLPPGLLAGNMRSGQYSYPVASSDPESQLASTQRQPKRATPLPFFDSGWQTNDRSAVKEYLNKLGETASARCSSANPTARTVLHDPMQSQPSQHMQDSPSKGPSSRHTGFSAKDTSFSDDDFNLFNPLQLVDSAEARRSLVDVSEPDPDSSPWNRRSLDVVDAPNSSMLSHEQLAMYSKPTPQNWNGPFFAGNPMQPVNRKSYDEELHDWFTGGNRKARQDEFYESIKAAHYATTPRRQPHPHGPIAPPKAKAASKDKNKDPADFNEKTTRLLIPVLENLSSYVEGPIEKRHGPFARYGPPPEWCIDKSPNGNKSFFGEDWGQAPERIGRDSRYRPMPNERRYGGFEAEQPAIGTLTALGRNVQPLNGRFRYGGGKKR